MSQKKLRLDDLQVESFDVLPHAQQERGTVEANILVSVNYVCSGTCPYKATCLISCPNGTCVLTVCAATCLGQLTCGGVTCYVTACDTCAGLTCGNSCQGVCYTVGCSGGGFCPQS